MKIKQLFFILIQPPFTRTLLVCRFLSLQLLMVIASPNDVYLGVYGQSDLAHIWSFYHQITYVVMSNCIIDNHTPVIQMAQKHGIMSICVHKQTRPHTDNSCELVDSEACTLPWLDKWLVSPLTALQYVLIDCCTAPFFQPCCLMRDLFFFIKNH